MKKGGILHPELSHVLASSGHTDYLLVTDRGFPVPEEPQRIDLALTDDKPTVLDVLAAIDAEWSIDRIVITDEMALISPQRVQELQALLPSVLVETISHIDLKRLGHGAKATIRTGDTCPYANCIIVSG
jgi:D-ribose pyranase